MVDKLVQDICGKTDFNTSEEANQCKIKLEDNQKKPYRYDQAYSGGGAEGSDVEIYFTVSEFPECTTTATFSSYFSQPNRLSANICAQYLSRTTGNSYTFQVVPDFWSGVSDSYTVVLAKDYTGAKATDHFSDRVSAEDAANALQAKLGKSYKVINTGHDYILEEVKE